MFLLPLGIAPTLQAAALALLAALFACAVALTEFFRRRFVPNTGLVTAIAAAALTVVAAASLVAAGAPGTSAASGGASRANTETPAGIRAMKFESTPNVYLIGMLSAIPDTIARSHFGVDELPLNRLMRDSGLRMFRNVFSETYPTRNAYDLLLSMDRRQFAARAAADRGGLFTGALPSPLFAIFRSNGYEINTIHESAKFGAASGSYVDRYAVAEAVSICNDHLIAEGAKRVVFLGGCLLRKSKLFAFAELDDGDIAAFYLARLAAIAAADGPQLTVLHTKPPIHYRDGGLLRPDPAGLGNFPGRYLRSSRQAANSLADMLALLARADPQAQVLVFGDHGLDIAADPGSGEFSAFQVRDRLTVAAGLYPRQACARFLPADGDAGPVTSGELVRRLVQCLSGGADPQEGPYRHVLLAGGRELDPSFYIYE